MTRRLLPLLLLAACAHPAHDPARAGQGPHAPGDSRNPAHEYIIMVDGVPHTDSSFQALGLTREQIDSVQVIKGLAPGPNVFVYTNRAAVQPSPE